MADKPAENKPYIKQVLHFYFVPQLHSLGTLAYICAYSYFSLYYIGDFFVAIHFLFYLLFGHAAFSGLTYLFTGLAFVVFLALPFCVSFYSIFILHKIWNKPNWATYTKWLMTLFIIIGGMCVIILSDSASRIAAHQPVMQSFIEDSNLTGRI